MQCLSNYRNFDTILTSACGGRGQYEKENLKLLLCAFFCPLKLELFAQGGDIPDGGQVIFLDLVLSRYTQIYLGKAMVAKSSGTEISFELLHLLWCAGVVWPVAHHLLSSLW